MDGVIVNIILISFLVKKPSKCGGCSPHATCKMNKCVCNVHFTGDGTTCKRKYERNPI